MDTTVSGFVELDKRIYNLIRALPDEIANALMIETAIDMKEMQNRTPVKTGDLKASATIQGPVVVGHEIFTNIVFGTDLTYAIYVHENLEANHPNGGQAKFVESVVLESAGTWSSRVSGRIQLERLL